MTRRLIDLPLLVLSLGAVALLMLIPAGQARDLGQHHTAQAFFYAALILLVFTVMLAIVAQARPPSFAANGQLLALLGAYVVLPLAMMLPLAQVLPDSSWMNLWFEMISSFTTTGATVYDPGRLSVPLHLWRDIVGWVGGFYVLMAAYAVLAPLNLGGGEVISGLTPGRSSLQAAASQAGLGSGIQGMRSADQAQRLSRALTVILPVYFGLTMLLWLALLVAGEEGFRALSLAMGTLSTSGISSAPGLQPTSIGHLGELLIFGFMLLALSRHLMPVKLPGVRRAKLRQDPELRLAVFLILLVVVGLPLRHIFSTQGSQASLPDVVRAFWGTVFTATSFLTTTGYVSGSFPLAQEWTGMSTPGLLLMALAMVGGGVATTAGGLTLLRVFALYLQGRRELEKIIHPSSISGGGAQRRWLSQHGAFLAWNFFILFCISIALVMAALTLVGLDFERALVLTVAALTTTGQLAQIAAPRPIGYAELPDAAKLILGIAMVVGRIETMALIALLVPGNWRR